MATSPKYSDNCSRKKAKSQLIIIGIEDNLTYEIFELLSTG